MSTADQVWSNWSSWSTCENKVITRLRKCGGNGKSDKCDGDSYQKERCRVKINNSESERNTKNNNFMNEALEKGLKNPAQETASKEANFTEQESEKITENIMFITTESSTDLLQAEMTSATVDMNPKTTEMQSEPKTEQVNDITELFTTHQQQSSEYDAVTTTLNIVGTGDSRKGVQRNSSNE